MSKKEALKELEELRREFKERAAELEKIINEPTVGYYDVVTPVDEEGDILFNDNYQALYHTKGFYTVLVSSSSHGFKDCSKDFVWVPCEREDIKAGDTFYRTDAKATDFSTKSAVKKALGDRALRYCYIDHDTDIKVCSLDWKYYYKLTKRSEVEHEV